MLGLVYVCQVCLVIYVCQVCFIAYVCQVYSLYVCQVYRINVMYIDYVVVIRYLLSLSVFVVSVYILIGFAYEAVFVFTHSESINYSTLEGYPQDWLLRNWFVVRFPLFSKLIVCTWMMLPILFTKFWSWLLLSQGYWKSETISHFLSHLQHATSCSRHFASHHSF